jgi:MEDS: MEthanogen/methylotroph, DcmR Sensory domain
MSTQTAASQSPRMISVGFDPEPWPAGTHMCMIFNDDEERWSVIAKFVQSGLDANEVVNYFSAVSPEELKKSMRGAGVTFPEGLDDRQFNVLDAEKSYCPDGEFKVDRILEVVPETYRGIIRDGYAGVRVTGDMGWARKGIPGSDDLVEFEARLNIAFRTAPTTGICQFDARVFDGATLYDILCVHPAMVVHAPNEIAVALS